ncbi:MAG: tRNA pseudouridine(55) synthase TruB [Polyangiaceae bacterium]|nr:tRNA pseudouridine(55) synthase TruB [Polyangiaceae bacterium]
MVAGVLIVDKPKGPTSHDVVAVLRRTLRTRQVGHAGTLDPMATGVLVVAVGEATKLVPWLTTDDKSYEATVRLGVGTSTLDADGQETSRIPISHDLAQALRAIEVGAQHAAPLPLPEPLRTAIDSERARTEQIPPIFSAVRIGGERAHKLARRGQVPDLAPRPVGLRRIDVMGASLDPEPELRLTVDVTKGYFVRSLARDLAEALGTTGHLTSLRRTRSGAFSINDAIALDGIWERPASDADRDAQQALFSSRLLSLECAVAIAMPTSTLNADGVRAARFGQRVHPSDLSSPHARPSAWLDEDGMLIAVGRASEDGSGQVLRGFRPLSI